MKTRSFGSFSPGDEDMSAYHDEQLVMEALGDSRQAFEQLVEQYQYRLLRTIASIVNDEQAAQDIAQETFLSAWSNLEKLNEGHKFGRWLNQIAINFSRRWLRDRQMHQEKTASLKDMVSLAQERRYQVDKLRREVWDAIDGLAAEHGEAVILYYISGYSYKEISEMLSVPVSTVQGRLQQARNQLRKEFVDMVTKLQLEVDSTVHKFLKEHAKQNGVSVEGLIIRLIERYKMDIDNPEIAVRKVSNWVRRSRGMPSPDGRYLSIIGENGNLAVHDLATGEKSNITSDGNGYGRGPRQYALQGAIWSPDGKQLAYRWHNEGYYELRIIGLDGSKQRVLYRSETPSFGITPFDWSQDGKFILGRSGRMSSDARLDIVLVSVADGSVRTLKSLERHEGPVYRRGYTINPRMSLSPDGRYVAYSRPKDEDDFFDVFLLATDDSGTEVRLVGHHDGNDFCPVWAPDGKTIVFMSDSGPHNITGLWLTHVFNGEQVGEPQLVKKEAGDIFPLGFTQEGSLYYDTLSVISSDISVATLDMETGEFSSPPTLVRSDGYLNVWSAWSPDGEKLAYVSSRPSHFLLRSVLVIRSMKTGEEREILPEAIPCVNATLTLTWPRWSPDGRSILVRGSTNLGHLRDGQYGLHLIDVQTGDVTTIVEPQIIRIYGLEWSRDGKTIYYIRQLGDREKNLPWSIVAHDLATGEVRELCPGGKSFGRMAISPDGLWLAFDVEEWKGIKMVSTAGGDPHTLLSLRNGSGEIQEFAATQTWTPDGRYLIFVRWKRSAGGSRIGQPELWRVPAEGGEPQKLREINNETGVPYLPGIDLHPDGRRIAFVKFMPIQRELWVMENLLTTFAAGK